MPKLSDILDRGVPGVDIDSLLNEPPDAVRRRAAENRQRARQQMPATPSVARGAAKRARARARGKGQPQRTPADVVSSLFAKAIEGAERPGPGIVPYTAIPEAVRAKTDPVFDAPVVGWDPAQLDPEELAMLDRMVAMRQPSVPTPEQEAETERMMLAQSRRGVM